MHYLYVESNELDACNKELKFHVNFCYEGHICGVPSATLRGTPEPIAEFYLVSENLDRHLFLLIQKS